VINIDPHNKKEKGLVPVPTPRGEIMWVHPEIIESQSTIVTHRKSSNVVGISTRETEKDVAFLTSSGEESALAAEIGTSSTLKTRSDKQYLKQYGEPVASSSSQRRRQLSSLQCSPWTNKRSFIMPKPFKKMMQDY